MDSCGQDSLLIAQIAVGMFQELARYRDLSPNARVLAKQDLLASLHPDTYATHPGLDRAIHVLSYHCSSVLATMEQFSSTQPDPWADIPITEYDHGPSASKQEPASATPESWSPPPTAPSPCVGRPWIWRSCPNWAAGTCVVPGGIAPGPVSSSPSPDSSDHVHCSVPAPWNTGHSPRTQESSSTHHSHVPFVTCQENSWAPTPPKAPPLSPSRYIHIPDCLKCGAGTCVVSGGMCHAPDPWSPSAQGTAQSTWGTPPPVPQVFCYSHWTRQGSPIDDHCSHIAASDAVARDAGWHRSLRKHYYCPSCWSNLRNLK
jgi:hypothetical protein